jgi:hypothetical protein
MEIIKEAFFDTAGLLPFLAAVYLLIGFLEYRYGERMNHFIVQVGALGPLAGALVGCIPQCGFSVIASALYVKRLISVGTLLAVFLSTSDEAIPVLLSIPAKGEMVMLLIIVKVIIAVAAGMVTDLIIRKIGPSRTGGVSAGGSYGEAVEGHPGCCSHGLSGRGAGFMTLIAHPLLHTVKIFVFLFALAAVFNFLTASIGETRISNLLLNGSVFQPVLSSFIGLIPSCFASVLLAGLFTKGLISFGSMVAGLCAGAGLGLMVLVKENKDRMDTLRVIGLLLAISILAGTTIQYLGGL